MQEAYEVDNLRLLCLTGGNTLTGFTVYISDTPDWTSGTLCYQHDINELLKTTSASTALLLVDMLLFITQEMAHKIPGCLLLHILTYVKLILRVSALLTI